MRFDQITIPENVTTRILEMLEVEIERSGATNVLELLSLSGGDFTNLRRTKEMRADLADRVVCKLWGAYMWHIDPELSHWYHREAVDVVPGVTLKHAGRRHRTPCKSCGCSPDLRTLGCKGCTNRAYRRRRLNQKAAA